MGQQARTGTVTVPEPTEDRDMVPNERLRAPYRLRDLGPCGRIWTAAFAVALLLAPIIGFLTALPRWAPGGDPAMMGLQALAVGSGDTPLTGQPSTSALYIEGADRHVDHLGPVHLYLMAGPMRLLGLSAGMLVVSLVVGSTCLLLMAWVTYRRLGPVGGVLGAVLLGLITFTAGAGVLTNPVSSHFAGLPLYCSALLLWCVMRGDIRLLPLATAVTAFAAQQHLSVVPPLAVLVTGAVVGLLYHWGRDGRWREGPARRQLLAWGAPAAAIGFVLWLPMLVQQITGQPGNLAHLLRLALNNERPKVGLGSAVRQIAHTLGLPPMLGRLNLTGADLTSSVPVLTWLSAGVVMAILVGLGLRWRHTEPEKASVVLMGGVLVIAGLISGSSVLDSYEKWRLVLYHWVFPLSFFTLLALALGAIELGRRALPRVNDRLPALRSLGPRLPMLRPMLLGGALLVVAVPAVINPSLDRSSNKVQALSTPIEREHIEELATQVLEQRDVLDEPLVILPRDHETFGSLAEGLTLQLVHEGIDVRLPRSLRHYVPDGRLVDEDHETGALLLVHDMSPEWREVGVGELLADVFTLEDIELATFEELIRQFRETDEYRFGPALRDMFESLPEELVDAAERGELLDAFEALSSETLSDLSDPTGEQAEAFWILSHLDGLHRDPFQELANPDTVDLLLERPLEQPALDTEVLRDIKESGLGDAAVNRSLRIRVYLLDHEELLEVGFSDELPRQ